MAPIPIHTLWSVRNSTPSSTAVSGPAALPFGPARGEGDSFSATILDPTSGKDTGSVLNIRGTDYDIDGEAGEFEDYWPR